MLKKVTKEDVTEHVNIINMVKEFSIPVEKISSGNFDYRCTCPATNHKNGKERNKSCYIDSKNNNFYCFACSAGFNCIDFYILCSEKSFTDVLNILKLRVNSELVSQEESDKIESNNFSILLDISNLLRNAIQKYPNDLKFFNKVSKQIDEQLVDLPAEDVILPEKIYNKLKKIITDKYGEIK